MYTTKLIAPVTGVGVLGLLSGHVYLAIIALAFFLALATYISHSKLTKKR